MSEYRDSIRNLGSESIETSFIKGLISVSRHSISGWCRSIIRMIHKDIGI